jgi:hypothetical protein
LITTAFGGVLLSFSVNTGFKVIVRDVLVSGVALMVLGLYAIAF